MKNNIVYSDKSWNKDVVSNYGLQKELEIIIKQESVDPENIEQEGSGAAWHWAARSVALVTLITLVGNLPVQSHLLTAANEPQQAFEIIPSDIIADTENSIDHTVIAETFREEVTEAELLAPKELELPKRAIETYQGQVNDDNTSKWVTYHVKSYDNPTNIFHKVGHKEQLKILEAYPDIKKQIKSLKKGSIVRANTKDGVLSQLIFSHDSRKSYVISKVDDEYLGKWEKDIFETRQARASFTLQNGLFFDGKKAGISNRIMKQFVKVFDWDIDFSHDVRVGDKATVVFEEVYHDGDKISDQHLLAAEFINKERTFRTIRYEYKDGKADFFTPEGREMKKAFIRTPISHARVSSHFNPGRFHPKLHKIRAHKGTDFAARTGTPIMTTGNGTIKFIGRKGGFGRTVIVKHREGYTTTYAHLSRYKKGLKVGSKVYQSDVIGYVGSSGLATGPHLHYEFHKNGKPVNPMTVSLPNSMSLSRSELQDFRNKAINLVLQLNVLHRFVKADIDIDSAFGG